MSFWVYILKCADGSFYIGQTGDLDRRLAEHHEGRGSAYVANRRPFTLAWSDWFSDRDGAFQLERQLKRWSHAKKQAFIEGDWAALGRLAVPPGERERRGASLDFARDEKALRQDALAGDSPP